MGQYAFIFRAGLGTMHGAKAMTQGVRFLLLLSVESKQDTVQ
jgi:hypothetical protein